MRGIDLPDGKPCFLNNSMIIKELDGTCHVTLRGSGDSFTRKARYKIGEVVCINEPIYIDQAGIVHYGYDNKYTLPKGAKWSNKLFMKNEHARHFIKILDVSVERPQNLLERECFEEGVDEVNKGVFRNYTQKNPIIPYVIQGDTIYQLTAFGSFRSLWIKINGEDSWGKNQPHWSYKFEYLKDYDNSSG